MGGREGRKVVSVLEWEVVLACMIRGGSERGMFGGWMGCGGRGCVSGWEGLCGWGG